MSLIASKKQVLDLLIKTYADDPYGVRAGLIENGLEILGEEEAKTAIHLFELISEETEDEYQNHHYRRAIESLAKQTRDAELFESVRLQLNIEPSVSSCIEIGRVYLDSGNPQKAQEWINRISTYETWMDGERL